MSLKWRGAEVLDKVDKAVRRGIDKTTGDCVVTAKGLTPVVTATLQGSIEARSAVKRGSVTSALWGSFQVDYAIFVEMGTSRMAGRKMLSRAADQRYGELRRNIRRSMRVV